MDCDVEEPNGRLFLKPTHIIEENVSVKIPVVNKELCTGCRKCVDFCKFNALALIKNKVLVFEEVCHSCGGCELICPEGAISEKDRVVGRIEKSLHQEESSHQEATPLQQGESSHQEATSLQQASPHQGAVNVYTGILNTGEVSGVPIIRQLLKETCGNHPGCGDARGSEDTRGSGDVKCSGDTRGCGDQSCSGDAGDVIIDCPPGCACVVMESIKDADYCILVAEPTIFGVHNLEMVYDLVKMFGKRFGVALNKCLDGENPAEQFCIDHNIDIIGRIPFDKELGLINSNGQIIAEKSPKFRKLFSDILENVRKEVLNEAASNS